MGAITKPHCIPYMEVNRVQELTVMCQEVICIYTECRCVGAMMKSGNVNSVVDLGGVRGAQMHPPLAASNLFLCT